MLPLLRLIDDGKEHEFKKLTDILATKFDLTEEEKNEFLPSGQSLLFPNRVGWARTYLKKAGLLNAPRRGIIIVTERGKKTLSENPTEINVKYLSKFPEFIQFKLQSRDEKIDSSIIINEEAKKTNPRRTFRIRIREH